MTRSGIHLEHADTDEQIAATYATMAQLRPHLEPADYVATIRQLMDTDRFRLLALIDAGAVRAVAGYRVLHMLYCGGILSIDDLVCDAAHRSRGYGRQLLDRLKDEARRLRCAELHLISRVTREDAHRFYFRNGLGIECFHFRARLQ